MELKNQLKNVALWFNFEMSESLDEMVAGQCATLLTENVVDMDPRGKR